MTVHLSRETCRVRCPLRPTARPPRQKSNPIDRHLHLTLRWLLLTPHRSAAPTVEMKTCVSVEKWMSSESDTTLRHPRLCPVRRG